MPVQIQLRRDTSANWASANPVLAAGEVALSTDTQTIKVGNGTSTWSALSSATLTLAQLAYLGLDQNADIIFGSGAATTGILDPSSSTNNTFVQANSAATLGVSRVDASTSALSGISTAGAVSGDLLRYNTSNSRWEPITYSNFLTTVGQRTVQNIAFRQAGYFSRGQSTTTVYKWAFPADTVSTTTSSPATMDSHGGFANPSVAGYFSRGYDAVVTYTHTTTVYKWTFPADTVSTTTSAPTVVAQTSGFANPSVAGYFSRGYDYDTSQGTTAVYKWAFPADTVSTTTAAPAVMAFNAGFANPSVAGYFSRGYIGPSTTSTTVYKWAFPADTVSTTTSSPATMYLHAGFSNPSVAGYFSRGYDYSIFASSTAVYKWTFPTDTVSTITAAPEGLESSKGFANPSIAGYFSRGTGTATVYKYTFPSDAVSTTTPAPAGMYWNSGFANA